MSTPPVDGKSLVVVAVVTGLAVGCAKLTKMAFKGPVPKLDFNGYDIGMTVLDIGLAMAIKDVLVKQNIIPNDILK